MPRSTAQAPSASAAAANGTSRRRLQPRPLLSERYLQDVVPQLLREHQLRIRRDREQRLAELDGAVPRRRDRVCPGQELDEVPEKLSVEELGGIQPIQYGHALRGEMTALLERLLTDGAGAGLQQQR